MILLVGWLAGSAAWLTLAAYRAIHFSRWLRLAEPAPPDSQQTARAIAHRLGIKRAPQVLLTGARVPPLLWVGRSRLIVLLPTRLLDGLEPGQQAALVAHELAHYRRRDHWMRWFETAVLALYWWHPVAWWARRRLQQAEEQCCDAWVLWAFPEAAPEYADTLIKTVDFLAVGPSALPLGASGFGKVRQLERRLTMILQTRPARTLTWPFRFGLFAVACLALPLSAHLAAAPSTDSPLSQKPSEVPVDHATAPVDPEDKVELRGTVLDADGNPAAGARVWAAALFVRPALRYFTEADDQGRFRFKLQPLEAPQRWTVRARLDAQGGEANDANGTVRITKDQPPEPVTIRMTRRGIVRGIVTEAESGKPIPRARLFLDTGDVVTTDDQGRYEVGGLRQAEHNMVLVSPGRERKPVLFDTLHRPEAQLDLRLPRAGRVVGRVTDEQGNPIPGAYVSRPGSGNVLVANGFDEACDAQGRFIWDGVPFNQIVYGFRASAPGYDPRFELHVVVREGEGPPDLAFRLEPTRPRQAGGMGMMIDPADRPVPGAIRGTVLDAQGDPIRDFRIRLQAPRDRRPGDKYVDIRTSHARTGVSFSSDDGSFILGVAGVGGFVRVVADAPGYGQAAVDRVPIHTLDQIAQADPVTLPLSAPHSLRVRVFDGAPRPPRPIAGALVTLVDGDARLDRQFHWEFDNLTGLIARTDQDGWATFAELSFGEATVLIEHPGFARRRFGWRNAGELMQVALAREAVLVGLVRVAADAPAALYYGRLESLHGHEVSFTVPADQHGRFRLDQLPAGTYELTLFDDRSQEIAKRALILQAGEESQITVTLPGAAAQQRGQHDEDDDQRTDAIRRAVEYLKTQQRADGTWKGIELYGGGVTALCTLALLEAGVAPDDEHVQKALDYLRTLEPDKTYTVAVQTMAFCAARSDEDLLRIRRNVEWLEEAQITKPGPTGGAWAYDARGFGNGDASNSHFAVLALASAARRSVAVDEETWKRADAFWRRTQRPDGSWGYRGTAGSGSMTCAGITALAVIRRELNKEADQPDEALDRAVRWLGEHFSVITDPNRASNNWYGYYMAALGRAGALANIDRFAEHDWRAEGVEALLKLQDPIKGVWRGLAAFERQYPSLSTSFALLFLTAANEAEK